jgi:L-lactate dehydrogenase complex protein LldG
MTTARDEVLARVRQANRAAGARPTVEVPRGYRRERRLDRGALLDLLTERVADYRATVHRARAGEEGPAVRSALEAALPGGGRLVVPPRLPAEWVSGWPDEVVRDDGSAAPHDLDRFAGVVTAAAAACAETGTVVLDGSPDQGRRAITLVPDVFVCVVAADRVVATVPELVARLDPTRPLTFVSGPSATSDIELDRVEGVHGPRTLAVVVVEGP